MGGRFECLEDYFYDNQDYIRDHLAEELWKAYTEFLSADYVLVVEETSEGFSKFDVVDTKEKYDVTRLFGAIQYARFYRGNNCGDTVRRMEYYDNTLESYMDDAMDNFLDWLEGECGIGE